MNLEKIITLASKEVLLQFNAMERSLRDTGCTLPLLVIPYNDNKFELPKNSTWLEDEVFNHWLKKQSSHPMMRKYLTLTESNYQFVDTDICFLTSPSLALKNLDGFITCCGHWHNVEHACNDQTVELMSTKDTNWQKNLFNAGQFASDTALYSKERLMQTALSPLYKDTILDWPHNDQPGMNLLVFLSGRSPVNITLPPHRTQSSWAGDYQSEYLHYWEDITRKPYLLHWAGLTPDGSRKVDEIFLNYLTKEEKSEWLNSLPSTTQKAARKIKSIFFK